MDSQSPDKGAREKDKVKLKMTPKPKPKARKRPPRQTDGLPLQRVNVLLAHGIGKEPEPEVLEGDELCYRWRMQRSTLRYYIRRGLLKPVKLLSSRRLLFSMEEIKRIERDAGLRGDE